MNVNASILLPSGKYFSLLEPETTPIAIEDIAHSLANLCRFGGHCREFYSVAQHSWMVSHIVPAEMAMAGLMHDAAEALVCDLPTPLKRRLPEYAAIEKRIERAIFQQYGLPKRLPDEVKHADLRMLATEKRDLMHPAAGEWPILKDTAPLAATVVPVPPANARQLFLQRFHDLTASQGAAA